MSDPAITQIEVRVAALLGARPIAWQPIAGGYTSAGRWRVRLASGATAFVKAGTSAQTAGWLRDEYRVYGGFGKSSSPTCSAGTTMARCRC